MIFFEVLQYGRHKHKLRYPRNDSLLDIPLQYIFCLSIPGVLQGIYGFFFWDLHANPQSTSEESLEEWLDASLFDLVRANAGRGLHLSMVRVLLSLGTSCCLFSAVGRLGAPGLVGLVGLEFSWDFWSQEWLVS